MGFSLARRALPPALALALLLIPAPLARSDSIEPAYEVLAGIRMATIPGGSFQMGTADTGDEWLAQSRPVRPVSVDSFQLSVTEITQEQFQRVMGRNPSLMRGDSTRPVDQVSWIDAVEFCNKLSELAGLHPCYSPLSRECHFPAGGFRLPTEAEWEFACRAGTTTKYYFGDSEQDLGHAGWYRDNSRGSTHPVAGLRPNRFGLFDMHGNVWEWCNDWFGDYGDRDTLNPRGPNRSHSKVVRGGAWHYAANGCTSAYRHRAQPEFRLSFVGFRVARSLNSRR